MSHWEFSPKVIEKIGDYVYRHIDPRGSTILYAGKARATAPSLIHN